MGHEIERRKPRAWSVPPRCDCQAGWLKSCASTFNLATIANAEHRALLPDGSEHWDMSLECALESGKRDRTVPGTILVLDQCCLGEMLLQRAGRPLIEVDDRPRFVRGDE